MRKKNVQEIKRKQPSTHLLSKDSSILWEKIDANSFFNGFETKQLYNYFFWTELSILT